MKQGHYPKYRIAMRLLSAVLIGLLLPGGAAWGVVIITPPDLVPLSQIAVPIPTNELQFIKDRAAAARLGKALFWDMQVGSDGVTACATCHFHAGTDTRRRNTVNPGPGNIWEAVIGPDAVLSLTTDTAVFPFHQRTNPDTQSGILRDFHDIVGSQGVRKANFVSITPGSAVDNMTPVADPLFNIGGGAAGNGNSLFEQACVGSVRCN